MTIHRGESIKSSSKRRRRPVPLQTLEEFNRAVDRHVQRLPVPKTAMVRALSSPPYFGIWCVPGTPYTHGGPEYEKAQIVDLDGRVVPGLYVPATSFPAI